MRAEVSSEAGLVTVEVLIGGPWMMSGSEVEALTETTW